MMNDSAVRRVRLIGRRRRSLRAFVAAAVLGVVLGFLVGFLVARVPAPKMSGGAASQYDPAALRLRAPRLPIVVDVTAYSLDSRQTDATPFVSRCGRIAPQGVPVGGGRHLPAVAVSRDLLRLADCGTRVRLNGREYVVWDTMSPRYLRRVDILLPSRSAAIQFGIQRGIFGVHRR